MHRYPMVWPVAVLAFLGACAGTPIVSPAPPHLMPAGETAVDRTAARGQQTYECRLRPDGTGGHVWAYVAAELDLLGADGKTVVGKHLFPPAIWQENDGSKLQAEVKSRVDAPQPGNAQWLLASTRSIGGEGRFAKITSLQRVNTEGGAAPARVCDAKSSGTRERVPFSAEYIYFSK